MYPYTVKDEMDFNDIIIATQKYINGRAILDHFSSIISTWLDYAFNIIGSLEKWRGGMMEYINNPDQVYKNVEEEIININ